MEAITDQSDRIGGEKIDIKGDGNVIGNDNIVTVIKSIPFQPPPILVPHLPPPPRDFTGRDEELQYLLAGFDQGATITGMQGMGGIGKTALAYALAEKLAERYPDGQILVELRGTGPEPMTAVEAMARVVRAYHPEFKLPESEAELAGVYHSLLHDLLVLLLLDNAASREQVEPLLPPAGCATIITSRNRFVLPGLKAKDLDVLPLEDAKKLLLEIADRIGGQAEELARLCGCLPIALRNAASVLAERKDLGVAEYLERLQEARNRVDLVEASFGLSYDLLSPELRRLWCLLSVFPPGAGFDRVGAAAVWALDQDSAANSLSDLVKWSLVEFDPTIRRYRLHDLARDFADSRLDLAARRAGRQKHAKFYKDVLSKVDEHYVNGGVNIAIGRDLFDREWSNIRAGQKWAEEMMASKSEEMDSILQLACDYPAEGAYAIELLLNPVERIRWLETALLAARKLNNRKMEGSHLGNLGIAYCQQGEVQRAISIFQQRLSISQEIGDLFGEYNAIGNLGIAYAIIGETSKSIELFKQHLYISRLNGDKRGEANDLGNMGLADYDLGNTREAIESLEKSLSINREIGNRQGEGANLGNLGLVYDNIGDARKAIKCYEQHLTIACDIGDRWAEVNSLNNLGDAYFALNDARAAIGYYDRALAIAREIGDRRGEGYALWNMSQALDRLDERSEAIKKAEIALDIYEQIGSPLAASIGQQLAEWKK